MIVFGIKAIASLYLGFLGALHLNIRLERWNQHDSRSLYVRFANSMSCTVLSCCSKPKIISQTLSDCRIIFETFRSNQYRPLGKIVSFYNARLQICQPLQIIQNITKVMKSRQSFEDMAQGVPREETDEAPILNEVETSSTAISDNIFEARRISRSHRRSKKRYEVLGWIIIFILLVSVGYLLYDNKLQEEEVIKIIKRIEAKTIQNNNNNKALSAQSNDYTDTSGLEHNNKNVLSTGKVEENIQERLEDENERRAKYPLSQIPKRTWYYESKSQKDSSFWTLKCLQRYKTISRQLQTELVRVNILNYGRYISANRLSIVNEIIQNLNARYEKRLQPQIIKYRDLIVKQLIIMEILIENGGIFVDEDIILTEDFSWIYKINENGLVNAKKLVNQAEMVAFYSTDISDKMVKSDRIMTDLEVQRYITLLPAIMSYFLAANKNNRFLQDLREQYHRIVLFPKQILYTFEELQIKMNTYDHNLYKHFFEIASLIVLAKQHKALGKQQAIAFYQIAAINQNYGPTKLKSFLSTGPVPKVMRHLSFISREQLEQQFGKLRYMIKCELEDEVYLQLHKIIKNKQIVNNSIIHSLMFASSNQSFVSVVKKPKDKELRWDSLPSKAWTYLTKDIQKLSLVEQMWLEHTKVVCQQSNFTFTVLNDSNLAQYLPKAVIERITHQIDPKNSKLKIYPSTKGQLVSLAIIYQHGGVWIDPLLFIADNFDWLRWIGKEKFIWNRNGNLPKAVLSFHPHYGSPFEWTYNEQGEKQAWHLSYEADFMAAQTKSELIKAWYEQMMSDLATSINDLVPRFYRCRIFPFMWINDNYHEYLAYDSLKCVLGNKKNNLIDEGKTTSPNDYYGLWSLNGFTGFLKLREYTNFFGGRSMDNPFIWRYSYDFMQQEVGQVHHMVKIYSYSVYNIEKIMKDNLKDFSKEIHKDSFIMRVLNKINGSIVQRKEGFFLQKKNSNMEKTPNTEDGLLLANISKVMWVYQGGDILTNEEFNDNMFDNIEYFAQKSSYLVRYITRENFNKWLSAQSNDKINKFIEVLKQRSGQEKTNLVYHMENLLSQLINLYLLYENGGIAIDKTLVLHQDLSWVSQIEALDFMNMRNKVPAKVFAFYSPGFSSKKIKDPTSQIQYIPTPSIQFYFIAAGKRSDFVKDLIQQFQGVILSHENVGKQIKALQYEPGWLHGDDPYYEAFFIASQFVLSKKQQELKKSNSKNGALEEYGLYTMNSRFFAAKINYFFNNVKASNEKLCEYLAKISIFELESYIGKLRYFSLLPRFEQLKDYVIKSSIGQKGYEIAETSFLRQYLVPQQQNGIVKYVFSSQKETSWDELPQDVWVYTSQGIQAAKTITKAIFLHVNASFTSKGYKVHEVNDKNIKDYLEQDVLEYWAKIIGRQSNQVHKQYIYRLLLLQKYGGVSISLNLIPVQDVSWIKKIAYLSPQLVYNRFQETPQVFMFFDYLRSAGTQWHYSSEDKTKVGHELGWNDEFIAVEKDNELIKEWLEVMQSILQLQAQKQIKYLEGCQVKANRRPENAPNKLRLDSLQCLLNRRVQRLSKAGIATEVCKYYRLWSANEYLGLSKFQDHYDYDERRNDLNPLLWNWSQPQTETLIGKVQLMTRLTDQHFPLLEQLIKQKKEKPWGKQDSLLVKTLYSSSKPKLKVQGDTISIIL